MGGELLVESEPGVGSRFWFTIEAPIAPQPRPRYLDRERSVLAGRRILVVHEQATHRDLLRYHLDAWAVRVETVASEEEATELVAASRDAFDCIIVDGSGQAASAAWQRRPACARAARITLTSIIDQPQKTGDTRPFLTKPISPARLYALLAEVVRPVQEEPQRPPDEARPVSELPMEFPLPRRILLAEDNTVNQAVVEAFLDRLGIEAEMVMNGIEAIAALRRRPYDLILMDVQMPKMDGLEATRRIRSDPGVPQPYIIAITANATVQDRQQCMAAGMDDYIRKPFRMEDLRRSLARFAAVRLPRSESL